MASLGLTRFTYSSVTPRATMRETAMSGVMRASLSMGLVLAPTRDGGARGPTTRPKDVVWLMPPPVPVTVMTYEPTGVVSPSVMIVRLLL